MDTTEGGRWAIFESEVFGEGWTAFPKAVQFDRSLSRHARFLYSLILAYAYKDPYAFPGRERLAQDMGCKQDSLSKYLEELDGTWINVTRRGQGHTNKYEFLASPDGGFLNSQKGDIKNSQKGDIKNSQKGDTTNKEDKNNSLRVETTEEDKSGWTTDQWVAWAIGMCELVDFQLSTRQIQTLGREFKSRLHQEQPPERLERLVQKGVVRGATYGYFWSLKKSEEKLRLANQVTTNNYPEDDRDIRYLN